jgi:hypothetical protein
VFANGWGFDGSGRPPAPADAAVKSGRILEIGPGLDGDQVADCTGLPVLPRLFDCHGHVTVAPIGMLDIATRPFSLQFYHAARHLANTLGIGRTTVRDAARDGPGRPGGQRLDSGVADADHHLDDQPASGTATRGCCPAAPCRCCIRAGRPGSRAAQRPAGSDRTGYRC